MPTIYNNRPFDWHSAIKRPVIAPSVLKGWKPTKEKLKELDVILNRAICDCAEKCKRRNNGKIAMTISGGLDSSFCLKVIRENFSQSEIQTFTIGKNGLHPDVMHAREIAKLCRTEHHEFIPSKGQIEEARKKVASLWPGEEERLGNVAVFMTYQLIHEHCITSVISCDGIDEQLGGYPGHRWNKSPEEKRLAFLHFWRKLEEDHLLPLERKVKHFEMEMLLPYLQDRVVNYIARIPLDERTTADVSKIPLRKIAMSKRDFPKEIIERQKLGFCSALDDIAIAA